MAMQMLLLIRLRLWCDALTAGLSSFVGGSTAFTDRPSALGGASEIVAVVDLARVEQIPDQGIFFELVFTSARWHWF